MLVLQGGGALGAYQLGVFEELEAAGLAPDWIAGVSIGAINGAILASHPPGRRAERLRTFWDRLASGFVPPLPPPPGLWRGLWSEGAALVISTLGVPGFFAPRLPPPGLRLPGSPGATSWYDASPLAATLEEFVDFEALAGCTTRLSVGAVDVETGNLVYFDNGPCTAHARLDLRHILASAALPPAFAPVDIDGRHYWDGGIVSNTPLQYVLDESEGRDKVVFQVDLFPARGALPRSITEVAGRAREIRFSSRSRLSVDIHTGLAPVRQAVRRLLERAGEGKLDLADDERRLLAAFARPTRVALGHIIYRDRPGGRAEWFEFSRAMIDAHVAAGRRDARATLALRDWRRPPRAPGIRAFDIGDPRKRDASDGERAD